MVRKTITNFRITPKTLIWVLAAYALIFVVGVGIWQGIIWEDLAKSHWLKDSENQTPSSFWISFVASALQDIFFFLGIGYLLFKHNDKDPKDDTFETKVRYFYPDVDADSEHMRYLINLMNKSSCVSLKTEKVLSVSGVQNGLIRIDTNTINSITNLHHNHDLVENEGIFRMIPDEVEYPDDVWGRIHEISIRTESSALKWIERSRVLRGSKYEMPYKIKLKAGEKGEVRSSHSMWGKIGEPTHIRAHMFTKEYDLVIENKTETVRLDVSLMTPTSNEAQNFQIEPHTNSGKILIRNFNPQLDSIVVKITPSREEVSTQMDLVG